MTLLSYQVTTRGRQLKTKWTNNREYVADWLASDKLSLNVNKTVYMTFGLYCNSVPKDLSIKTN